MSKIDMMKMGLSLVSHIEPILKEIVEIKGNQKHGKQEIISKNQKHYAIYREFFENESDAKHFLNFCNRVYAMKNGQLPPINILIILFKSLLPIMVPKSLTGQQSHGQPKIQKTESGQYAVVLKEVFSEKIDCENHLDEATKIKSMRF